MIEALIADLIGLLAKEDNQEFAIFYEGKDQWEVMAVNPSLHCPLGEVPGEYSSGRQTTLEEAMLVLLKAIRSKNGRSAMRA